MLLDAAEMLQSAGHEISFIHTVEGENYYGADIEDFAALARRAGARFSIGGRLADHQPAMTTSGTDVAISVNWPRLIRSQLLTAFPFGILNAHAGDLPRYRGNACPNWAILNFERRVGVTVHRMVEEVDAGPVLVKAFLEIDETTYVGDIYNWLETIVPSLFVHGISQLGTQRLTPQDPSVRPLRTFPRRAEDSRIEWKRTTRDVLSLVRASSRPFPGAFTFLEGKEKINILRARPYDPDYDFLAMPGQVCLRSSAGNPVVATGDGMIELEECASADRDDLTTRTLLARSLRARLS